MQLLYSIFQVYSIDRYFLQGNRIIGL